MSESLARELYQAVYTNDSDYRVKSLLEQGADPNHELFWSEEWIEKWLLPPLHVAFNNRNVQIIKMLVQSGAYANKGAGWYSMTPLHYVFSKLKHEEVPVPLIREAGCKVDVRDKDNWTPLHWACDKGHLANVKCLVEVLRCDIGVRDDQGRSPLDCALGNVYYSEGCVDVALYLINRGCGDDEDKVTVLCGGCCCGMLNVVKELVDQHRVNPNAVKDDYNDTPIHCACEGGSKEVVQYLVEILNCDIDITNDDGKTPLEVVEDFSTEPFATRWFGCEEVASYLKSLKVPAFPTFVRNPKNIKAKPGSKEQFSIKFSTVIKAYQWYIQEEPISSEEPYYEGVKTDRLVITKCLPKHRGAYKCVATDLLDETYTSGSAALKIVGEKMKQEESKLLGEILKKADISLMIYGVDVEQLAEGSAEHTYEELEYVLQDNPSTHVLSINLKEELKTRLEEEKFYKEAMANDHKVSLSYTKILALGPGQVGKSTFLYRLMGIMKGNIQTADPETQPQCSTGIAELREAYITYTSRTGALTSDSWQVFDKKSDLQCQLEGLMSLLLEQTPNMKKVEADSELVDTVASDKLVLTDAFQGALQGKQPAMLQESVDFDHEIPQQFLSRANSEKQPIINKLQSNSSALNALPSQTTLEVQLLLPQLSNIDLVIEEFENIQAACKIAPSKTKFRMLFNVADIGGQPAFLEMLPSLTIGPAFYLVFMKLLQGLTTQYPAAYKCQDGGGSKLCKNYTYTSEEVIFTALSSIACFGNSDNEVEQYVTDTDNKKQANSLALLVGTFRDEVKDEKLLDDIDHKLQQKLEVTDFFNDGLIHSKSFLRVDNYSASEAEIEQHRKLIEEILNNKFRKYEIPTRWLTLSICLKLLARRENRHDVSFADCVKLGSRLGMKEEMVKVALQFLHKYIGLVMYFPKNSKLKNVVICDPQVVFSSISELIFDIYDPRKMYITEAQHDHFVRTGCFSPQDIKPIGNMPSTRKLLPIDTLVHLLAHLNIIAEVPLTLGVQKDPHISLTTKVAEQMDTTTEQKKYYFLPAVLQTAVIPPISRGANEEQLPEPLCIGFKTGYLPLGFACALSANLIGAENSFELIPFEIGNQQITYKNKIRFRFQGEYDIVMISGLRYCEFHVTRCSEGTAEYWDSECCPRIRTILREAADRVIQSMQHGSLYKLTKGFELAFKCPNHLKAEIGHKPLAKFVYEDSSSTLVTQSQPKKILCTDSLCKISTPLSAEMKMWFGEGIPFTPPEITKKPSVVDGTIKIQAEGTKPLKYQWFKDDEELSDGDEYKGSTTAELVIVGTDPQLKGKYKCQVYNKSGEIFSQEILYDPFVIELRLKGLKHGEISKIIDNEIESLEDMESLTENDIDSFNIRFGAKKRVLNLISSLSERNDHSLTDQTLMLGASARPQPLSGHSDFNALNKALWEIRANWYLLGIQLDIEHSNLEVIRRESNVDDKFTAVLNRFLNCESPLPTRPHLEAALISPTVGRPDLVRKLPASMNIDSSDQQPLSDHSQTCTPAARLRRVVNALWELRAHWERIAGPGVLIPLGTCDAIQRDYRADTGECFAAFLHEHLKGNGDPGLSKLLEALRSPQVGRADVAMDLEEKIEKRELW